MIQKNNFSNCSSSGGNISVHALRGDINRLDSRNSCNSR